MPPAESPVPPKLKSRSRKSLLTFVACFQLCWRCWSGLIKFWLLAQFETVFVNAGFGETRCPCQNKVKINGDGENENVSCASFIVEQKYLPTHDFTAFRMIVSIWLLNTFNRISFEIYFPRNNLRLELCTLGKSCNRVASLCWLKSCQRPATSVAIPLCCTIASRVCSLRHLLGVLENNNL